MRERAREREGELIKGKHFVHKAAGVKLPRAAPTAAVAKNSPPLSFTHRQSPCDRKTREREAGEKMVAQEEDGVWKGERDRDGRLLSLFAIYGHGFFGIVADALSLGEV